MKKLLGIAASLLCSAAILLNPPLLSARAEDIVFPSGVSQSDFEFLLDFQENDIDMAEKKWGATAIGAFNADEVLCTGYYACTDAALNAHTDENSVFEWGEVSQTLIWVSAMQLWEQGKLDLDRDIRDYLPDGFFRHLTYDEPITMIDLMNGTAGWQKSSSQIWKKDETSVLSLADELQAAEPLQVYRPGEVPVGSLYSAAVAGYVIECAAGQDYCGYVHEHILEPLGMEHTSIAPTHSDNPWVYEQRRKMKTYEKGAALTDKGTCLNYLTLYPAGSAVSTLPDLMTFSQALLDEDSPLFQSENTRAELFSATSFYGGSDIPLSAHGLQCQEFAVRAYGHEGATAASHVKMLLDPESGLGLVVMINQSDDDNHYFLDFPEWFFGTLPSQKYADSTSKDVKLSRYYLPAELPRTGILKFITFFNAVRVEHVQSVGSGAYQLIYDAEDEYGLSDVNKESKKRLIKQTNFNAVEEGAILMGTEDYNDGTSVLSYAQLVNMPAHSGILEPHYTAELCLFTAYLLLAVAAVYLMLIRRKLKKHKAYSPCKGSAIMKAGQTAWLASVLILLITYTVYVSSNGIMSSAVSAFIGISQTICMTVCAAAAISALVGVISEKRRIIRYITNALGNITVIAAITFFEMYKFR